MRCARLVLAGTILGLVTMGRTALGQGLVARTEWSDTHRLDGSPDSAGLLVLDIWLDDYAYGYHNSTGAELVRTPPAPGVRPRPAFFTGGGGIDSILLFRLQPGTYVLSAGRISPRPRDVTYKVDESEIPAFEIRAGEIRYIGRLTLHRTLTGLFHFDYRWSRSDSLKAKALEAILRRYPESPWAPVLRDSIASLRPAVPGTD